MARQKPYTPKAVEPPAGTPADPVPPPPTCSGCRHWRERNASLGLCVFDPPSVVRAATVFGPLCGYPLTAADTPACAKTEPK